MKHSPLELRSAIALETRDDNADPLAAATRVVEELRTSVATFQTAQEKRFNDAIAAIDARLAPLSTRLDEIETRAKRPGTGGKQADEQKELENRAFTNFIRRGRESLTDIEARTMKIGDDTSGGFLAPPEFVAEVVKGVVAFSPIRSIARVGSTASNSVKLPKLTSAPTGGWVGEVQTRPTSDSAYGQIEIGMMEYAVFVDVSNSLLEDSAVDVAAELAFDLAQQFGAAEGAAFVSGTGINQPMGFLSDATVVANYTPTTFATGFTSSGPGDCLIDAMFAIKAAYRTNGTWVANGKTLGAIRKMKDGQGRYLLEPSLAAGITPTIAGRPYIEAPDMPDLGSGTIPIVYGDFSRAFRIYDRVSLSLLRDPYSRATSGVTRFHARRRVGSNVVLAEALRAIKCSVS
jgi:HK97 family phage major capsid protein